MLNTYTFTYREIMEILHQGLPIPIWPRELKASQDYGNFVFESVNMSFTDKNVIWTKYIKSMYIEYL